MNANVKKSKKSISTYSMRLIPDLNKIGRVFKKKIRDFVGVKTTKELIELARQDGVALGKRDATQEKRAYKHFGISYNDVEEEFIEIERLKDEIKKKEKAKQRKSKKTFVNVTIGLKGYRRVKGKKGKGILGDPLNKFSKEEKKIILDKLEKNPVEGVVKTKFLKDKETGEKKKVEVFNTDDDFDVSNTITIDGVELKHIITREFYLHSKTPIQNINEWIKEKLDMVLVNGFKQSPFDWVEVKLIKKNIINVKKPKNPRSLPIRDAGSLNLDHHTLQNEEWDKKRNMCVVDFILWKYGQRKGFIKPLKTNKGTQQEQDEAVEYYSTHFEGVGIDGWERNAGVYDNPNKKGYTIDHIEQFCENFEINMICLIDGEIKYNYTTDSAKKNPAFVFEMKNNHLYPICDTYTIQKYTKIIRDVKSNNLQNETKKEVPEKKISLPIVYKDKSIEYNTKLEYAVEIMEQENTQTHYPTDLVLNDNVLSNFELKEKKYLLIDEDDEINKDIVKYCDDKGLVYEGQPAQTYTHQYLEEFKQKHYSYFNDVVREALCNQQVKDRTHRGVCVDKDEFFEKYDHAECFDMNKQYRYAMENPLEFFMTIDFEDVIVEIDNGFIENDTPFGMYYVRTFDKSLFFGNNWYCSATIKEAKKLNISFNVFCFVKGTPINDINILKDIIDEIEEDMGDYGKLKKSVINSIYGMMAKTKNKKTILKIDTDINRVYENYLVENGKSGKNIYVDEIVTKSGKKYYAYGNKYDTKIMSNNLPISIQIQDFANIYFNRMIDSIGGQVLWRKTDCAMIHNPVNINVSKNVGGYDYHTKPNINSVSMDIERNYEYYKPSNVWKMINENDSDDWEHIIEQLIKNGGGMLNGRAGTGKSFACIKGMEYVKEKYNMKSQAIAFTNKATIQLNGKTIDSFLRMDKDGKINKKWAIGIAEKVDLCWVDEISMIGKHRWKLLSEFHLLTGIPFILVGDDRQLPPVEPSNGKLIENENYDENLLDDMKHPDYNIDDLINGTNITYKNKTRQHINNVVQNAIKPSHAIFIPYKMPKDKDGNDIKDGLKYHQDAWIFKGAKLIMFITPKCKTLKKNECVEVIEFDDENISVSNGIDKMNFQIKDFHKTFLLGYATTTHKSQGDTCDGLINIFDTEFMMRYLDNNGDGNDWFNHPAIYSLCNGLKCELTQMKRYDVKLWDKLEEICESNIGGKKAIYTAISRARKYENVKIRS